MRKKSIEDEQTLEELNINEINFLGLCGRTLTYDLSQAGFSHTDLLAQLIRAKE